MRTRRERGFTLIELMVVITILGLLATIAAVNVVGFLKDAKIEAAKSDMRTIKDGIERYRMKKGRVPDSIDALCGPEDDESRYINWTEPQKDPWGNDYVYEKKSNTQYDIMSWGPDGQEGTDDDIKKEDLSKRSTEDKTGK